MARIRYQNSDLTVQTINDRNNIQKRPDQMKVAVLDATADTKVGRGWALYMWLADKQQWVLLSKEVNDTLSFAEETKNISNDTVRADYVPVNATVWDVWINTPDGAIPVQPSVDGSLIAIGPETPGQFDGMTLHYVYAYSTMSAQIAQASYSRSEVDAIVATLRNEFESRIAALEATMI